MFLFLHVSGIKGLHCIGLELVVTVERGIKADKLLRICFNDSVYQFFCNTVFQTYEKCAVGNGEDLLACCRKERHLFRWLKAGFEEYFKKQVFLCGLMVDMVNVQVELFGNLFRRCCSG